MFYLMNYYYMQIYGGDKEYMYEYVSHLFYFIL